MECYLSYNFYCSRFAQARNYDLGFEPQKQNCGPVAGAILENFPKEVEAAASIAYFVSSPLYNGSVRIDARKILADSLFFKTMGIEVLSGNPEKDLMQNDVIFLSDDLAQKIYGGENPIGKVISYNKELQLTVKGTYVDLPENATMRPEAVISMPTAWSRDWGNYSWRGGDSYYEYIRFRPGADKEVVNTRLDAMIQKYRPEESGPKKMFKKVAGSLVKRIPCQAELQLALNVLSVPAVNRNLSREATEAVNHWLAGVAGTDGKEDESVLTIDRFSCQLRGEKMDLQADVSGFKLERLLDCLLPQGDSVGIRVLQGIRNNISEQESYQLLEYIVWWANEHRVYQLALDTLQKEEAPQYKALRQIQPHIEYVHVIRDNT